MSERKDMFFETVFKDEETAQKYLAMSPEEIAAELNASGFDYSADEIKSYGEDLQKQIEKLRSNELDEEALDDVAGGKMSTKDKIIGGIALTALVVTTILW